MRNYSTIWHVHVQITSPNIPFDLYSFDEDDALSQAYFCANAGGGGSISEPERLYLLLERDLVCFAFGEMQRNQLGQSIAPVIGLSNWLGPAQEWIATTSPKKSWSNGH
jgi:hypothetical protein